MKKTGITLIMTILMLIVSATALATSSTWKCPNCGLYMTGNYCSNCGTRRPTITPTPKPTPTLTPAPTPTPEIISLTLPESLTSIEDYAFKDTAATLLIIPENNEGITFSSDAFTDCQIKYIVNLSGKEIKEPDGIKVVTSFNMILPTYIPNKKFGFSCPDGTNSFFMTIENAIRKTVEENDGSLLSLDPQNNCKTQIAQIEELIRQGIDGIFICPVDPDGIIPALDELKAAGIPIFGFDTEVADMSYEVTYAGSDNYNAGYVCGVDLAAKCPDGGDIIVLDSPTMQSVVDRTNGFLQAIADSGVKFNVVAQIDSMGDSELSCQNATDALTAHPDAVCIFGGNDPIALGAYAAAVVAGSKALIYGVDGSPDIKDLIAKGKVTGTSAQSPISIGKTIVALAYKYMAGETVDPKYSIYTFIINSDNIADYNNGGWQ